MSETEHVRSHEEKLLNALRGAIFDYDSDKARDIADEIRRSKIDPLYVMNDVIAEAAATVGEQFENGLIYLPHLVIAGEIMTEITKILESSLGDEKSQITSKKKILIGTVKDDIHSIGKNIVAMFFRTNGFEVFDLGVDVSADQFVRQATELSVDVIAASCLLTTTMIYQKELIDELVRLNIRNNFKVIIGGGPITEKWATEIGVDGQSEDAIKAVSVVKEFFKE